MTEYHPFRVLALMALFIGSISLANAATAYYGGPDHMIPVGLGLTATAGTLFAGACLAARDALQDAGGRAAVFFAILGGIGVSVVTSTPALALASGVAFGVSELLDTTVYTPLRERGEFGGRWWTAAVVVSGLIGSFADTILFLWIAGFPIWSSVPGQMLGKAYPTVAFLIIGWAVSRAVPHHAKRTQSA